ncbi:MAG: hypothetical protein KA285_05010 [Bacteroidia bacterium]|nr:hypothetical protein [Bacteroidia bacterium]
MKLFSKATLVFIFIALFSLLHSCKEDEIVIANTDHYRDFYRVDIGYWIEYAADSIVHLDSDDALLIDTAKANFHFFIREQIDSSIIDGEGDTAYVVSRYKRTSDTIPWSFESLWTSKLTQTSLQRVEDNRRYVRLTFPFNTFNKWNGNAFNELPEEEYSYEDVYSPASYSSLNFDSAVTVNQNEFISNINRIIRKEIYGNHVGLLYKQADSVGVAFTSSGPVILSGVEYEQTVIDYKR